MRPRARLPLFGLLLVSAVVGACATSTEQYRLTAEQVTDEIVGQLEKRTDVRHVRVVVQDFMPCETTAAMHPAMGASHATAHFVRRLRHQIMSALARKVTVLDGQEPGPAVIRAGASADPPDSGDQATAVLVGNYSPSESRVLVMARLIDLETNQVLAATDHVLGGVDLPPRRR